VFVVSWSLRACYLNWFYAASGVKDWVGELCTPSGCNSLLQSPFVEDPIVDSEILHGGEDGDVEQWFKPRNKSFCLRLLYCLYIYLFIINSFLSINTHLNKIAIKHLNSYLEKSQGEIQSPSWGIQFQVLFWVIGYIISYYIVLNYNLISYTPIHPPLCVISIGIRAMVFNFWLNNFREILVANHFIDIFILIYYSKNGQRY